MFVGEADFKQGFQIDVFSNKNLLGVREFASTAGAVIEAMNSVYDDYDSSPESKTGKLPIVKCVEVKPIVSKHGTNYQPVLAIVGWADRPTELAEKAPTAAPPIQPAPAFSGDLDDDVPF